MIAWGGTPFGAAIGGWLAQVTTIRVTYLIMVIGVGITAVIGWRSPLRDDTLVRQKSPDIEAAS